jgi:hypothetical protein
MGASGNRRPASSLRAGAGTAASSSRPVRVPAEAGDGSGSHAPNSERSRHRARAAHRRCAGSPRLVSRASRMTSACASRPIAGRPGARCGYVQRRATSRCCQRSSVRGLTEKTVHLCRGRARLSAVSNSRSASRSRGRRACRRKIESSCRSTRISNSFHLGERQRSTTSSNRRRTTKYASDHSTRDLQRAGIADASEPPSQRPP